MIREFLGKKAAESIDRTKFARTRTGKVAATILDDDRLVDLARSGSASIADKSDRPVIRKNIYAFAAAANILSYMAVFLIPTVVSKVVLALSLIFSKAPIILLAPSFGFTMIGTYSLLRKWFPEDQEVPESGDVMHSYGTQSASLITWKLWVVACGAGGMNAIILAFSYLSMTGEWD